MNERIEPFDEGGSIKDRIDEIVATGVDVHFEMLDRYTAWMRIGPNAFSLFVQKGELHVRPSERLRIE